jgi:hypothetical protein
LAMETGSHEISVLELPDGRIIFLLVAVGNPLTKESVLRPDSDTNGFWYNGRRTLNRMGALRIGGCPCERVGT